MIQHLNNPQLSAAKPRTGLQSIADLIPRLVRQYEIQAELRNRQSFPFANSAGSVNAAPTTPQQATFGWYE